MIAAVSALETGIFASAISTGMAMAIGMITGDQMLKNGKLAFPYTTLSLATFYILFAVWAQAMEVALLELVVSLPIWLVFILSLKDYPKYSGYLGLIWLLHGVYDLFHDKLFINPGTPEWFPIFCFTADILIGVYLLVQAFLNHSTFKLSSTGQSSPG
jgi:hypothetical protein